MSHAEMRIELMRWMPPPDGIECAKVVSLEPRRGRHPYWGFKRVADIPIQIPNGFDL